MLTICEPRVRDGTKASVNIKRFVMMEIGLDSVQSLQEYKIYHEGDWFGQCPIIARVQDLSRWRFVWTVSNHCRSTRFITKEIGLDSVQSLHEYKICHDGDWFGQCPIIAGVQDLSRWRLVWTVSNHCRSTRFVTMEIGLDSVQSLHEYKICHDGDWFGQCPIIAGVQDLSRWRLVWTVSNHCRSTRFITKEIGLDSVQSLQEYKIYHEGDWFGQCPIIAGVQDLSRWRLVWTVSNHCRSTRFVTMEIGLDSVQSLQEYKIYHEGDWFGQCPIIAGVQDLSRWRLVWTVSNHCRSTRFVTMEIGLDSVQSLQEYKICHDGDWFGQCPIIAGVQDLSRWRLVWTVSNHCRSTRFVTMEIGLDSVQSLQEYKIYHEGDWFGQFPIIAGVQDLSRRRLVWTVSNHCRSTRFVTMEIGLDSVQSLHEYKICHDGDWFGQCPIIAGVQYLSRRRLVWTVSNHCRSTRFITKEIGLDSVQSLQEYKIYHEGDWFGQCPIIAGVQDLSRWRLVWTVSNHCRSTRFITKEIGLDSVQSLQEYKIYHEGDWFGQCPIIAGVQDLSRWRLVWTVFNN